MNKSLYTEVEHGRFACDNKSSFAYEIELVFSSLANHENGRRILPGNISG